MEAKAEDVTAGPGTRYEHVHSGGSKCIHRQERKPSAGRSGLREGLRRLPRNRSAGGKGSIIDEGHVSVRGPGARDDVRSMAALAGPHTTSVTRSMPLSSTLKGVRFAALDDVPWDRGLAF